MPKVALAYSGGLDTSVAIKWLQEKYGLEVIAVAVDLGEENDYEAIRRKGLQVGAVKSVVVDAREEFARDYVWKALAANALYEGRYPVSTALGRPLIARLVGEVARQEGAQAVSHGCTGKGNDQVRFDVTFNTLFPELSVIACFRDYKMTREEAIDYAAQHSIPVPVEKKKPYSTDVNLWGRSIECGVLEDPWVEPPADIYQWTVSPAQAPEEPEYVEVEFACGVPVALDGEKLSPAALVNRMNARAGRHGVGRIDMVENRLVGFKSRENYECPAATALIAAHRDLEALTMERDLAHFKATLEPRYAELIYYGLWHSPLREALDAFMEYSQRHVSGTVRLRLHKGTCVAVGRRSPESLYQYDLATYDEGDKFDASLSHGFIQLWGLPSKVAAQRDRRSRQ